MRLAKSKGSYNEDNVIWNEKESIKKEDTISLFIFFMLITGNEQAMKMLWKEMLLRVKLNEGVSNELTI